MERPNFVLPGMDPFSVLDNEIARLKAFFSSLRPEDWKRPTRCDGWTVRDMLAHFDSDEEYDEACLNNSLKPLIGDVFDLDGFNDRQVKKRAYLSNEELLEQWRARQEGVRQAWQDLGLGAKIPTMIGLYPLRSQIWHLTSEYATHADDMDVEVPPGEQEKRILWRFQFSAFAVQEKKNPPDLELSGDRMVVTQEGRQISFSMEEFVAAVSARLKLPENRDDRCLIKALRSLA
jgi:uncharacterized protein (TIGR03083 family)